METTPEESKDIACSETLEVAWDHFRPTTVGLTVEGEPSYEQWEMVGKRLKHIQGSIMWWVGDWLNYGERSYGEMYSQALEATEYEYQTLRDAAWVSTKVEMSRRRDNLSWSHHREIAALEPQEQDELLEMAEAENLTRQELRARVKKHKELPTPELPAGKYNVIYADPPWPVGSIILDKGKWTSPIDDKYPTMEAEDIQALPVAGLASEDCALFMWTTHTFIKDAMQIIEAWGFKYHCLITWDKGGGWTQFGIHRRTEFLIYAYKGKMNIEQKGKSIPTIFYEQKKHHSKKPDSIRDLIKEKTPVPRIELFARDQYEGWDTWGNQAAPSTNE